MVAFVEENFKFSSEEPGFVQSQPDTLLAYEFLEHSRGSRHPEPETRLMVAILEDAVGCFQKYLAAKDPQGKESFREAEAWILAQEPDWLFSFDNICETLGLDPNYLREGLLRWKEAKLGERGGEKDCGPGRTKWGEEAQAEARRSSAA